MQVVELAHHLELAPVLARWHADEWRHLYRGWDVEAAEAELVAMDRPGRIPTTWVAFDGAGRTAQDVLGSVSVIDDDELDGFRDVRPWLASLYVVPSARGRGVGTALVALAVEGARALGVERLHLFTSGQEGLYAELGWHVVARTKAADEQATVMAIDTDPEAPRRAVVTSWCSTPDIATAYTYLRPGGSPADRDRLAQPIAPGLLFAGEATSSAYPGTMHGAWFSGERAAERVVADGARRVVVVGAGLAGIAAARRLGAAGIDTTVVEAGARPGGRVQADTSLGGPVNMGAAWTHGDQGNPVAEAARGLGIAADTEVWSRTATFVSGLGRLDPGTTARLRRAYGVLEDAVGSAAATASPSESLGPHLRALLARLAPDRADHVVLGAWARSEFENLYAAPLDDLSLSHCAEPFHLPGADGLLLGSTSAIVDHLAEGLDIRCRRRATAVRSDAGTWQVDTEDGTLDADAVVVTTPVGALHAGRLTFEPPLPDDVVAALGHIGAGRIAKVVASFDDQWWAPHRSFQIAADPPAPLAVWVDVSDVGGRPMLCAFATGETAERVETMDEPALLALVASVLCDARVTGGDRP